MALLLVVVFMAGFMAGFTAGRLFEHGR